MKITRTLLAVLSVTILGIYACSKKDNVQGNATIESSSGSSAKPGELVSFKFNGLAKDGAVDWKITPAGNVQIHSSGNTATVIFSKAGDFVVTAQSGSQQAVQRLSVSATGSSSNKVVSTTASLDGDEITLVPSFPKDSINYLLIRAETKKDYDCLNNFLVSVYSEASNAFTLKYIGVEVPDASICTAGKSKAVATNALYMPVDGTYSFTIKFNNKDYIGSVVKKGTHFNFTWSYTSGVIISPQSI
ncbi:hypothetical protein ACTJJ0_03385 [Chitinophaga sp. 22321]|uniref:Uncharacterized protein n=1 Tax=Chitinophaga hostae TaxID=2831022 RepID=A0ABS5IXU3_9BACT|nr:hypothetical protein [Chitinophaga hostae]MBS0027685.1 hypothetical protein [Chitinophaga hostae]